MDFEAGQFVVLGTADLTGGRAYSMVNFDQAAGKLALVLKRKPGGRFSDWLFTRDAGDAHVDVSARLDALYSVLTKTKTSSALPVDRALQG